MTQGWQTGTGPWGLWLLGAWHSVLGCRGGCTDPWLKQLGDPDSESWVCAQTPLLCPCGHSPAALLPAPRSSRSPRTPLLSQSGTGQEGSVDGVSRAPPFQPAAVPGSGESTAERGGSASASPPRCIAHLLLLPAAALIWLLFVDGKWPLKYRTRSPLPPHAAVAAPRGCAAVLCGSSSAEALPAGAEGCPTATACVPLGWATQQQGCKTVPSSSATPVPRRGGTGLVAGGWSWHPAVPPLLWSGLLCTTRLLHPLLRPWCWMSLRVLLLSLQERCPVLPGSLRSNGKWVVGSAVSRNCSSCSPAGLLAPPGTSSAHSSFTPLWCELVGGPACQQPSERL